jgi:hypothetical protein
MQQVGIKYYIGRFIMFSVITKIYCCNDPCLKVRIIASVKNIDSPMLTRGWQELEYRIDVCRVTRGAPSNICSCKKKTFQSSCGCKQSH